MMGCSTIKKQEVIPTPQSNEQLCFSKQEVEQLDKYMESCDKQQEDTGSTRLWTDGALLILSIIGIIR